MSIKKVRQHPSQNEALIFERSQTGRVGYSLPPLDIDSTDIDEIVPPELRRTDDLEGLPEVSEIDVVRHFTRISTWNYSIDLGMYPLGSCTMKYNSRLNEKVARIGGFAGLHPLAGGRITGSARAHLQASGRPCRDHRFARRKLAACGGSSGRDDGRDGDACLSRCSRWRGVEGPQGDADPGLRTRDKSCVGGDVRI